MLSLTLSQFKGTQISALVAVKEAKTFHAATKGVASSLTPMLRNRSKDISELCDISYAMIDEPLINE